MELTRIAIGVTLGIGFAISGYHRRKAATADATARRSDESTTMKLLRLVVALPAFGTLLLAIVAPRLVAWASFEAPMWLRVTGVGVAALGVPLAAWLFPHLGRNVTATTLTKQTHELVTTGPYAYIRHPLYLTGLLFFLGAGLALGNRVLLIFIAVFVVTWTLVVIPREEAALEELFGQQYRDYRQRTGALLPFL